MQIGITTQQFTACNNCTRHTIHTHTHARPRIKFLHFLEVIYLFMMIFVRQKRFIKYLNTKVCVCYHAEQREFFLQDVG